MATMIAFVAAVGCRHNLPPAAQLMHPGPGVDGPGPGVMTMFEPPGPFAGAASQIAFVGPESMVVNWDVAMAGQFDSEPLICPGRYNFPQGGLYRLKLTNIPGRPGLELYPTLEVGPATPRSEAYLAHNAIPVQFTEEDFDQVTTGNFVTKAIYLPDADYQELAIAGVETLVSTRLDPGFDPIVEADRRGIILAIVRVGNKDLQIPVDGEMFGGVGGALMPAAYCGPSGMGGDSGVELAGYVSGVSGPQYGMPISGTPIGLPGPPHVPLGHEAGLKKHTIFNWTKVRIPNPVHWQRIHVKQSPGMSYPRPPRRAYIHEKNTFGPLAIFTRPWSDKRQVVH